MFVCNQLSEVRWVSMQRALLAVIKVESVLREEQTLCFCSALLCYASLRSLITHRDFDSCLNKQTIGGDECSPAESPPRRSRGCEIGTCSRFAPIARS